MKEIENTGQGILRDFKKELEKLRGAILKTISESVQFEYCHLVEIGRPVLFAQKEAIRKAKKLAKENGVDEKIVLEYLKKHKLG